MAIDAKTLAAANAYTDSVALGQGAVPIPGPQGEPGIPGLNGADGIPGQDGAPGQDGINGADGQDGADGVGVPAGGTAGQMLAKASNDDFDTVWKDPPKGGGTPGTNGTNGTNGWSPLHETVETNVDGKDLILIRRSDWIGGSGTKPVLNDRYLSSTGYTNDPLSATNFLFKGWTSEIAYVSDNERRVAKIVDWTGGSGTKPAINVYISEDGFTTDITEATDMRGTQGTLWHTGIIVPASSLGITGDLYLNTLTWDVYKKTAESTWENKGRISVPQFPYVRGKFLDRSFANNVASELTPDVSSLIGDISLIAGNEFVATSNGRWALRVFGGIFFTNVTNSSSYISRTSDNSFLTRNNISMGNMIPDTSIELFMTAGESLITHLVSMPAQTTMHNTNSIRYFEFFRTA
ncbi:MAG: collagen-like protein [Oscillospiraceae bacterium]|nr:collagen-like protein [Oscillospiraceae bacterium]